MADAIYQVQEARWDNERIYTARGEHVVTGEPYFVYDAIYGLGTPWITLAEDGSSHDDEHWFQQESLFKCGHCGKRTIPID